MRFNVFFNAILYIIKILIFNGCRINNIRQHKEILLREKTLERMEKMGWEAALIQDEANFKGVKKNESMRL